MSGPAPIRVLVVDDSAFARKVLREALSRAEGLEVVGTARDGLDALEKIAELRPDVVTLDLVMPGLDGVGVLKALHGPTPPRVVVVSMADSESELAMAAMQAGAVELVHKPTALATDRLYELADELVAKVRIAAGARPLPDPLSLRERDGVRVPDEAPPPRAPATDTPLVVIGTSTGGPQALTRLLMALPPDFPSPVAIALHIPPGYTQALAERLNTQCALEVLEASDGLALRPGRAVLARAGLHLKLEGRGEACVARLDLEPLTTPHRPAVDVLFESAARAWGKDVLAVVLTGMGNDGLEGARRVRAAGGRVLTEAQSSCVVYGMPRSVDEAGLSSGKVPLERMAAALLARV
ncbi:chemotaxis-specific protein-glutamate methyltransferase CheB [Aggregicoccus sp. 17bor-14]|uniref:chemotaxis-specific protein-glutamate methyltransferase CheB n=1 Tax=Myxococcaceae TaxID=31 RepID=UPI00129C6675|nr:MULTISPECIES: chemotaxis-specific protein-glutamate methyltransferase CheB [Myxococcaceae]MBF5045266.1 chemotaxis-specific protein-glutamate methyltransferase CheB [Simulacricoccus sp. 17bor-14]MRI91007.1 chemotaxis-specific protein-glutamate methyltransferase CheB [Aggregicoccus sp. 17bor-14]